jgi:hypothetical protein
MTWTGKQIYRRSPEELAAHKAKRENAVMHCQCCGRDILAKTGKIAHHGYERPGTGWQTASCMGARHEPFEASRDRLGDMIKALKGHLIHLREVRSAARLEQYPLRFNYTTYGASRGYSFSRPQIKRYVEFTRETFDTVVDAYYREGIYRSYDKAKERELAEIDSKIEHTTRAIAEATKRYNGWKRTHKFENKKWVAV